MEKGETPYAIIIKDSQGYRSIDLNYEKESKHFAMISFARKLSFNPFFVKLSYNGGGSNDIMGIFKNGKLLYIDDSLKVYKNVKEIIISRFGSIKKYEEILQDEEDIEKIKSKISILNLQQLKNIIKNDYLEYTKMFPADTTKAFSLLINEMDKVISLNNEQKYLLKQAVLPTKNYFRFYGYNVPVIHLDCNFCEIRFLSEKIDYKVKSVLTHSQYDKYIQERNRNNIITQFARNRLYEYYNNLHVEQFLKGQHCSENVITRPLTDSVFKAKVWDE